MTSTKILLKEKQRNILLLGRSGTTNFIKNYENYWRSLELQVLYSYEKHPRTSEITRTYFTLFDEELCFIDTPETFKVHLLYKVLRDLNDLDAILLFTNGDLSQFELEMQKYFNPDNYPREKIIFIAGNEENSFVTSVNLENKLKKLRMTTKVSINKNLFLVANNFFSTHGLSGFCRRLKQIFSLRPCTFQFGADIQELLLTASEVFLMLVETSFVFSDEYKENVIKLNLFRQQFRYTVCKTCTRKQENLTYCHFWCNCLDQAKSEELNDCSIFYEGICNKCHCSLREHISSKYYTQKIIVVPKFKFEHEKIAILHLLAILYLFCKQHHGLREECKNFKKEHWNAAIQRRVFSDDPLYKEIEDKIEELESSSYQTTVEEVSLLLEQLEDEKWHSFEMEEVIETNCTLKLIPINMLGNTNLPRAVRQVHQRPRFPEMKSQNAFGN